MRCSLSVDRGDSTASGGNFKVGKCDPPLPPASSAFPSPPFSLPPLHACAGAHRRAGHAYTRRYPRRCRCVRRSRGMLGAAGAGLQLLLGPGTSGFDVTFLFLVHDAEASWPRSTQGAPSARPSPPLRAPATPPTQRTDPAPSRHLAPPTRRLAHLASTSPAFALVCAQEVNLALLPRPGSRSARRGGATAAAPPVRAGRPLGCPGGARSGEGGGRRGAPPPPPRWPAMGPKGPPHTGSFFFQAL